MIDPGRMQHRVSFARRAGGEDGYGNTLTGDPVAFLTVWGELMETRGREALAAGRLGEIASAVLIVWDTPAVRAVLTSDVVLHEGVTWNIRSGPIPLLRDRGAVEFALERGVAA